uniref:hypothetical protein n=1 Tax=Bradyrhizobium sp. (strain ORS 278) TaxID=114615 RepID=UPI00030955A0|nr:hypothetical protein [Bradyrhizobium sp. ORS 278]
MKKTQLAMAALVTATLAAAPFAAEAKHHKKHHSSMSTNSSQTTGANMQPGSGNTKSGLDSTSSSQGNVGPGTNQAGSMGK